MKTVIIIFLALITFGVGNLNAQTAESVQETEQSIRENGKYAIMVMKAPHLKTAVTTGIEFKTFSNKIDFQIIVCGELVKEISQDAALQSVIKNAVTQHGLKVLVCGLSIEQLKVDKTLLPKEISVTKNGLIYMFGLQEKNYKSIVL